MKEQEETPSLTEKLSKADGLYCQVIWLSYSVSCQGLFFFPACLEDYWLVSAQSQAWGASHNRETATLSQDDQPPQHTLDSRKTSQVFSNGTQVLQNVLLKWALNLWPWRTPWWQNLPKCILWVKKGKVEVVWAAQLLYTCMWGPMKGPTPGLGPRKFRGGAGGPAPAIYATTGHCPWPHRPRRSRRGCPSYQTRSCSSSCSTILETNLLVDWDNPRRNRPSSTEGNHPDGNHVRLGVGGSWALSRGSII